MTQQTPHRFVVSWSGGKDSCHALQLARAAGHRPVALLSMLEPGGNHSRSHGLAAELLLAQAERMALPLLRSALSWRDYEAAFVERLIHARDELGADAAVFGDIDVQTHRDWVERVCARPDVALTPLFPLWEIDRRKLVEDTIAAGQQAKIVSCNERLGEGFLGRALDAQTLIDLEAAGVDACGENGEYHTFVVDCGGFSRPIAVREVRRYQKHVPRKTRPSDDYWFLELQLAA
jgi:uncharacterized protein (TIGR00290 family)